MSDINENIIEFTLLFNRYKKRLYNYVLKMTQDRMLTEDIVQDIFVKLYQNLDILRFKTNVNYWLFTIARNEVYAFYRRKKIRTDQFNVESTDDIEVESKESIENEIENNEVKELIQIELNNLPPDRREIFILKEYSGLSYKEIATMMEIDKELVKSRLYKVRQKLIKKISMLVE